MGGVLVPTAVDCVVVGAGVVVVGGVSVVAVAADVVDVVVAVVSLTAKLPLLSVDLVLTLPSASSPSNTFRSA